MQIYVHTICIQNRDYRKTMQIIETENLLKCTIIQRFAYIDQIVENK